MSIILNTDKVDVNEQFELLVSDYANSRDFEELLLHALIFSDYRENFVHTIH